MGVPVQLSRGAGTAAMADPITLTNEAFTGGRPVALDRCTMVVAHANLARNNARRR